MNISTLMEYVYTCPLNVMNLVQVQPGHDPASLMQWLRGEGIQGKLLTEDTYSVVRCILLALKFRFMSSVLADALPGCSMLNFDRGTFLMA